MRVLIAPDGFGGTLTAREAASAVHDGWLRAAPGDDLRTCPLSDGGPGFLDTLRASLGGELVAVTVSSPLGEQVPAAILLVEAPDGARTAYVESAHALGLPLVPPDRRDLTRTTSYGVCGVGGVVNRAFGRYSERPWRATVVGTSKSSSVMSTTKVGRTSA